MSICNRLGVTAAQKKISPISYHWGQILDPPHPPLPPGNFFPNRMVSSISQREGPSTKNEFYWFNIFRVILHTDRQMQSKKPRNAKHGRGLIMVGCRAEQIKIWSQRVLSYYHIIYGLPSAV